jgi:hypothetical protein
VASALGYVVGRGALRASARRPRPVPALRPSFAGT